MPDLADKELDDSLEALARSAANKPADMNFFRRLGLVNDELRQSSMLAWLIDARAPHGRGRELLNRLLHEVGATSRATADYSISREYAGPSAQVDIVASHPDETAFVLYLENKVWSAEGDRQTEREEADLQRLLKGRPDAEPVRIFLTIGGHEAGSGGWHPLSYWRLGQIVQAELSSMAERWRAVVEDWIASIPSDSEDKIVKSEVADDEACLLMLGALCDRVTARLDEGLLRRFTVRRLRTSGGTKGQMDLECALDGGWEPGLSTLGISVGVERLHPDSLIAGTPAQAPQLWAWHSHGDFDTHLGLVRRLHELAQRDGAHDDFGFLPQSAGRTRHGRYIATEPLPQYRMGTLGFSQELAGRMLKFMDRWTRLISDADELWSETRGE
jgi:PD-(D/E)XK nuclease superfamily